MTETNWCKATDDYRCDACWVTVPQTRLMRASARVVGIGDGHVTLEMLTTGGTHMEVGDDLALEWYGVMPAPATPAPEEE